MQILFDHPLLKVRDDTRFTSAQTRRANGFPRKQRNAAPVTEPAHVVCRVFHRSVAATWQEKLYIKKTLRELFRRIFWAVIKLQSASAPKSTFSQCFSGRGGTAGRTGSCARTTAAILVSGACANLVHCVMREIRGEFWKHTCTGKQALDNGPDRTAFSVT